VSHLLGSECKPWSLDCRRCTREGATAGVGISAGGTWAGSPRALPASAAGRSLTSFGLLEGLSSSRSTFPSASMLAASPAGISFSKFRGSAGAALGSFRKMISPSQVICLLGLSAGDSSMVAALSCVDSSHGTGR
jgi:hypothetical protein